MEDKGYEIRAIGPCDVCIFGKGGHCHWPGKSCRDVDKCEFAPVALRHFKKGR